MKAKDVKTKTMGIQDIYSQIESAGSYGYYKIHIPHFVHIKDNVKLQLVEDGFKVYVGDWDGFIKDALIIEW